MIPNNISLGSAAWVGIVRSGGGGALTLFAEQATGGGASAIGTYEEQGIKNAGTIAVKEVHVWLEQNQANTQVKVQIFQGGSQVGADSSTVTYSDTDVEHTFTFASAISVTGDFVLRYVNVAGQPYYMFNNSDPYETGNGYDVVGNAGRDSKFRIYIQ